MLFFCVNCKNKFLYDRKNQSRARVAYRTAYDPAIDSCTEKDESVGDLFLEDSVQFLPRGKVMPLAAFRAMEL